jgi:predicted esterase
LRRPVGTNAFADLGFPHCCFSHSGDGWDEHILLLLHGLGDTDDNFVKFGAKLQLPQTSVLALRAPLPLLDMGFTWFDVLTPTGDVCFDSPDAVASLRETSSAMLPMLQRLHHRYGYALRNIYILGFSQGGTVALAVLQSLQGFAIGGVVSICGPPPAALPSMQFSDTAILFTLGELDSCAAAKMRAWAQFERQWRAASSIAQSAVGDCDCSMLSIAGKGEAMIQGAEESRALMQFFSRHLALRSLQLCVVTCLHVRFAAD